MLASILCDYLYQLLILSFQLQCALEVKNHSNSLPLQVVASLPYTPTVLRYFMYLQQHENEGAADNE